MKRTNIQRFEARSRWAVVGMLSMILGLGTSASSQEKVYFTSSSPTDRTIQRANLDGTNVEVLVSGLVGPNGLTLDTAAGKVYWTEENGHRIVRANLDGSGFDPIISGLSGFPADVALDVAAEKLYWVEFAGGATHSVRRANLDGSSIEDLVPLVEIGNRNGIALDLDAGKIYWTLCGGIIRRANLDGSAVEDVLTGLGCLVDIVLDLAGGKMYWADGTYGAARIQRANLDGTELEDLVTTGLILPFGMFLTAETEHVYWTDSGTQKIQRANLDGSNVIDILTGIPGMYGIAIDRTPVFFDGFESGDTSAWSVTVP